MIDPVKSPARVTRGRRGGRAKRPAAPGAPPIPKDPELPDVLQFMRLLWAVDHGLQRTSKRMLRGLGVTGPQRFALRLIGQFPSISAGDLATLLHVHPSTLTGILARLLDQKLILRTADKRDARRSIVHLSTRGMRVDAVRAGTVEAAVSAVLRRASASDQQCAAGVLRQLAEALVSNADDSPDYDDWRPRPETASPPPPTARNRRSQK
jgi:MarR family transcriptional regulator, organic hydroperoxide resistance regulator